MRWLLSIVFCSAVLISNVHAAGPDTLARRRTAHPAARPAQHPAAEGRHRALGDVPRAGRSHRIQQRLRLRHGHAVHQVEPRRPAHVDDASRSLPLFAGDAQRRANRGPADRTLAHELQHAVEVVEDTRSRTRRPWSRSTSALVSRAAPPRSRAGKPLPPRKPATASGGSWGTRPAPPWPTGCSNPASCDAALRCCYAVSGKRALLSSPSPVLPDQSACTRSTTGSSNPLLA